MPLRCPSVLQGSLSYTMELPDTPARNLRPRPPKIKKPRLSTLSAKDQEQIFNALGDKIVVHFQVDDHRVSSFSVLIYSIPCCSECLSPLETAISSHLARYRTPEEPSGADQPPAHRRILQLECPPPSASLAQSERRLRASTARRGTALHFEQVQKSG